MEHTEKMGCLFCDFGDIYIMRESGYKDDRYVFCEKHNEVIPVIEECPYRKTEIAHERAEAYESKMRHAIISAMADYLENNN